MKKFIYLLISLMCSPYVLATDNESYEHKRMKLSGSLLETITPELLPIEILNHGVPIAGPSYDQAMLSVEYGETQFDKKAVFNVPQPEAEKSSPGVLKRPVNMMRVFYCVEGEEFLSRIRFVSDIPNEAKLIRVNLYPRITVDDYPTTKITFEK